MATAVKPAAPKAAKPKTYKFPKAIGACADLLYELKAKRAVQQRLADELEEQEKALKEYIINTLPKSQAGGVSGKVGKVEIVRKVVPQVKDYTKLWGYIWKTKSKDLFQKRLNEAAINERWEAGKKVPGVEPFHVVTVSCTKA